MDQSGIEKRGLAPLQPELDKISAIASTTDLARVLGEGLRADVDPLNATNYSTEQLFGLFVAQGLEDPQHNIPYLLQGGLGMPDRDYYLKDTERFAKGLPANNALLWGARGMGKSSLVKAVHADINTNRKPVDRLKLIEIHREDIESLPGLMDLLRNAPFRFIVFCDDLSFDGNDASYKSLKAVLEGGIEGRPDNVILYATSNRRHLLAREMIENERSTAINPGEAVEEKVSLSDRFGLWLGFHRCSQDEYLAMVQGYCTHFGIRIADDELEREALEWSTTRGSRSGRVAWQFTQELAGRLGVRLTGK
jgi:predicted AAA+ superfamily ATPase